MLIRTDQVMKAVTKSRLGHNDTGHKEARLINL